MRRLAARDGRVLDTALVLWMPGPATATGEDLVELHLHGGRAVVAAVERALARIDGLRAAEPGEFTRRAFESGRLDLSEAEGLADLLAAETEAQRSAALMVAEGGIRRLIEGWQERLLALAAMTEAELDFSDEDDVAPADDGMFAQAAHSLAREIGSGLDHPPAERLRDGIRVVIAGPVNAGKSTLLNALAGREAAIVTAQAGTTRDVVEVPVALGGLPFVFADTAGLRDTEDAVERIGIARARAVGAACDLLLWLGPVDELPVHPNSIIVAAQADRLAPDPRADVAISALTGEGMAELTRAIVGRAKLLLPRAGSLALSAHQQALLGTAQAALVAAAGEGDALLRAEWLRAAGRAFDRVTGRAGSEDVLDALFGRFCIGK